MDERNVVLLFVVVDLLLAGFGCGGGGIRWMVVVVVSMVVSVKERIWVKGA